MRIVVIAILIYFAFQFVFRFLVPIFLASRKMKQGFRDMQERMQEQMKQQQGHVPEQPQAQSKPSPPKSDYIEFEEL